MNSALADATVVRARVTGTERIGEYHVLSVRAGEIARRTVPGQFVMLSSGATLNRPFSVFRAEGDEVAAAFDVIGAGTEWLARRSLGDEVMVVGPLGRGFSEGPGPVLAVGGGYGAAPLFLLADRLRGVGIPVHAVLGAARGTRVFAADHARAAFDSAAFTTEDGSLGARGLVTDLLAGVATRTGASRIAACGPMPMLEAVAAGARELGISCEVAVEEFMACGIGVCWTCVIPIANGNGEPRHDRSCTEGPVFDASAVAWG